MLCIVSGRLLNQSGMDLGHPGNPSGDASQTVTHHTSTPDGRCIPYPGLQHRWPLPALHARRHAGLPPRDIAPRGCNVQIGSPGPQLMIRKRPRPRAAGLVPRQYCCNCRLAKSPLWRLVELAGKMRKAG